MENIKVSICIPVYNAENYIETTLKSVINQTFKEIEIIVIDNKSTDKTIEKIEQIHDSRIKLIKNKKNYGMVGNWNICLKHVRGEYIQFVCADDILEKNCLEEKVKFMDNNKDVVLVFSSTRIINQNGKYIMTRKFKNRNIIENGVKVGIKSFRTRNVFGEPSNVLFRSKIAKQIGEFNEMLSYTPDWEYWIKLSKLGKVGYINIPLSKFRVLGNSGTGYLLKNRDIMRKDDKIFIKSIKNFYGKNIKGFDIFSHKLIGTMRLYAKIIFLKLVVK